MSLTEAAGIAEPKSDLLPLPPEKRIHSFPSSRRQTFLTSQPNPFLERANARTDQQKAYSESLPGLSAEIQWRGLWTVFL